MCYFMGLSASTLGHTIVLLIFLVFIATHCIHTITSYESESNVRQSQNS